MPRVTTSASTRDRILDVAAELMRSAGLAGVTTREIARGAGLTEAALYRHFRSKEDLLTCALAERLPVFIGIIKDLPQHVGQDTLRANLARVAEAAVPFYRQLMPTMAAIFGDPHLLARHRLWAQESGLRPQRANAALAAYLQAEQTQGRVAASANVEATAALLLGACLQRAFFDEFLGHAPDASAEAAFARELVDTLLLAAG